MDLDVSKNRIVHYMILNIVMDKMIVIINPALKIMIAHNV